MEYHVGHTKISCMLTNAAGRVVFLGVLMALFCISGLRAQVGVGANFGIEADAYSGDVVSGVLTDDWFYNGLSGAGVVDEATAAAMGYGAQLAAGNNIAFDLRQSIPNYASNNGYIWYSTRFGRDHITGATNDQTTFTGGKNGDNPMTAWGVNTSPVPDKSDIVDVGVHMRRDGIDVTDDLWAALMISTLSSSGNHFVDFELFVSEIQNTGTNFINSGPDEGHTAWRFDASGNVTTIGDMIIGFSYGGGGVSGVEIPTTTGVVAHLGVVDVEVHGSRLTRQQRPDDTRQVARRLEERRVGPGESSEDGLDVSESDACVVRHDE